MCSDESLNDLGSQMRRLLIVSCSSLLIRKVEDVVVAILGLATGEGTIKPL